MLSTRLRRTRGTQLALPLRSGSHLRRPCRSPGTRPEDHLTARGRFVVATEHLPGDSVVVRLAGELDYAALTFLDRELRRVERESRSSLLIDAADVTFVDLSIVARLAIAHQRLEAHGGGLLVAYPPECLLRLLDLVDEIELPVLR